MEETSKKVIPNNKNNNNNNNNDNSNNSKETETLVNHETELDIEPKAPKKRGRPAGSKNKANTEADSKTDKITGMPKTSPKKTRAKKMEISEESIQMSILGIHALLATYAPKAMISMENAQREAKAIKTVVDTYNMEWLIRYFPIVALAGTIGFCEIPTIKALKEERDHRRLGNMEPNNTKNIPENRHIITPIHITGGEQ